MKIVCLDTEHSSNIFKPWEPGFYLTCVGIVTEEKGKRNEELIWFDHRDMEATIEGSQRIQEYIDTSDLLVMHNSKHDMCVLNHYRNNFDTSELWCTMITDYLLEGQNKKLKWSLNAVAERYGLEQKMDEIQTMWDNGIDTYNIPDYQLGPYCLKDCNLTLDIYHKQKDRVEKEGLQKVVTLQNEYIHALREMETNGLLFNEEKAKEIIAKNIEQINITTKKIVQDIPDGSKINLSSPQQLSAFLYGGLLKLSWKEWVIQTYKTKPYSKYSEKVLRKQVEFEGVGFQPNKRDKKDDGYYKVDKDTIRGLAAHTHKMRALKKLLVKYSEHAKIVSTLQGQYGNKGLVSKIQSDQCIHPSLNQTITATGRLSSSNPNGQNLFPIIKKCFEARHDGIMQVDLSQIEWRDAAWLAQDQVMIKEINSGVDQHVATLEELMEMNFLGKDNPEGKRDRDHAKVFNFRMIFGGTEWGFYLDLDMPTFSIKKWKRIIKAFWLKYYELANFHAANIKFVFRNGYFQLPTGRWFKFNKKHLKGGEYGYAINQIKNFPIQGMSGGDILPLLAVIIRRGMLKMKLKSMLILTVHDSILFDYVKEEKEKLARLCYNVGNNLGTYIKKYYGIDWNVNLEVEVETGPDYGSLKYISPKEVRL